MPYVEKTQTKWAREALLFDIASALSDAMGTWPTHEQIAVVYGVFAQECGRDGKGCHGHNLGNISGSFEGNYTTFPGNIEYDENGAPYADPAHRFKVYPHFRAAVADWLSLIRRRYVGAWRELGRASPSPLALTTQMRSGGYFTAPLPPYFAGVRDSMGSLLNDPATMFPEAPQTATSDAKTSPETPTSKLMSVAPACWVGEESEDGEA